MPFKRVRVIAGPNGSGKTTLCFFLKSQINMGVWLNADEILEQFRRKGFIEYSILGFVPDKFLFNKYCKTKSATSLINQFSISAEIKKINFGEFAITFSDKKISNEAVAFLTDFFRFFLSKKNTTFSTETVLSHPSKLLFFQSLKKQSFKTYLYFVATSSPEINIGRIKSRVVKGGHTVPPGKIKERFFRSILLLKKSVKIFDRVFIFDNSDKELKLIVSYSKGLIDKIFEPKMPEWLSVLAINK
jgi:predicted ABC-type ATPase